jgi:hypothetical protein
MIPSRDCVWNDSKITNSNFVLTNIDRMTQNVIRMGVINKYHYVYGVNVIQQEGRDPRIKGKIT